MVLAGHKDKNSGETMTTTDVPDCTAAPLIENHTVDYVPLAERHGKARDLFHSLVQYQHCATAHRHRGYGGSGVPFESVVGRLAIALGHMIGGVVIALASAQGPRMGIPQMVQSRGQFGRYGALLIVFFAAIDLRRVLHLQHRAGRVIDHGMVPSVPLPLGIVIGA
jgi:purine-cytosine permease-like protein